MGAPRKGLILRRPRRGRLEGWASWFETRKRAPHHEGLRTLKFHARPRGGLADIFIGLLECVFQRLGRGHVSDLIEARRDRLGRPVGWTKNDALVFHDLDHRSRDG